MECGKVGEQYLIEEIASEHQRDIKHARGRIKRNDATSFDLPKNTPKKTLKGTSDN